MTRRRVRASSVLVWRDAFTSMRAQARSLLSLAAVIAAVVAAINVYPRTPDWQAGFLTGTLATFLLACMWWIVWVPSGLAHRSMGSLAEEWTNDALRAAPGVHAVIPSLKFEGKDVDHVVIAAAGVAAVETKWRSTTPDATEVLRVAEQAAAAGRTLRLSLRRKDLPEKLFSTAVVYWGPGAKDMTPADVATSRGNVTVVPGHRTEEWLARLRTGAVGTDYAESLSDEVHRVAVERDGRAIEAGRVLRWLARTK